jgi:nitrous oxide reductase accessory protein NosL
LRKRPTPPSSPPSIGGKVLRFGDIKADMVDLSGGALHDTRM